MKILPKIYEYLRLVEQKNILQTKTKNLLQLKGLRLDSDTLELSKFSSEKISKAYNEYAQSPYVNAYLRKSVPLSNNSNEIVSCLRQAICESEPVCGRFYRGLSNCNDEKSVRKFIFNNKGFTSVTPESNKRFAESFAIGSNGAIVEFDLKNPVKAFQPNSYEVIFNTDAFKSDKYDLIKIKDGYYKVVDK